MTAHYLLHDFRKPKKGTRSWSTLRRRSGALLVQWLKHLGARVIGTVSTEEKPWR